MYEYILTGVVHASSEIGVGPSDVFEIRASQRPVVVFHKTVHFDELCVCVYNT